MAANPEENMNCSEERSQHEFQAPKPMTGDLLKAEEEKLKAKYHLPTNWRGSGHSAFLQKKLAKGQKYFDSGDYQMAKQTSGISKVDKTVPHALLKYGTGEAIPTPDTVPARKTSIIQPKFTPTT